MTARAAYNALAREYDSSHLDAKDRAENAHIWRLLGSGRLIEGTILDVGCGTGFLLDLASEHGVDLSHRYVGVDVAERMVEVAREKYPLARFVLADMHDLDGIAAGQFDSVVSLFGVYSYSMDPWKAMDEVARALKPGGRFFIQFYSPRHAGRYSYLAGAKGFHVPRRFYNATQARTLFTSIHFEQLKVFGLSAWVDAIHSLPTRFVSTYYRLEAAVLRRTPDHGKYTVVQGRKR